MNIILVIEDEIMISHCKCSWSPPALRKLSKRDHLRKNWWRLRNLIKSVDNNRFTYTSVWWNRSFAEMDSPHTLKTIIIIASFLFELNPPAGEWSRVNSWTKWQHLLPPLHRSHLSKQRGFGQKHSHPSKSQSSPCCKSSTTLYPY